MDMKKISCVAVALMILSVGCFVALGPGDSKAVADDAPILAADAESENGLMSMEEMETAEYFTILMPVYDMETGTFSTTDFEEVRMYTQPATSAAANGGGVNKVESFRYYAQTSSWGFTEHYDGYKIYLSHSAIDLIIVGGGVLTDILGLGIPTAVASVVIAAMGYIGQEVMDEAYPNGMIFVVSTGIYVTPSTTVPLVTLLHTESQ